MPTQPVLILKCRCGHQLRAQLDGMGKRVTCVKCGRKTVVTKQNSRVARVQVQAPQAAPTPAARTAKPRVGESGPPKMRIGEMLLEAGLISEAELGEALAVQKEQGKKLAETLIGLGHLKLHTFVEFLARQPGVASIDINSYNLSNKYVNLIPRELAVKHEVFPIDKMGRLLTVVMACPLDHNAIRELEDYTKLRIKALLCTPSDVRAAINTHYPRKESESIGQKPSEKVAAAASRPAAKPPTGISEDLKNLMSLPILPQTAQKIREAASTIDTPLSETAEILVEDPPAMANILGAANDPGNGFPAGIDSPEAAVILLGIRQTYDTILNAPEFDYSQHDAAFDYRIYWMESMCCASLSEKISGMLGLENLDRAYLAGLFHNLGTFVLYQLAPQAWRRRDDVFDYRKVVEHEKKLLNTTHVETGADLVRQWNFPREIVDSLRYHHEFAKALEAGTIPAIVAVAGTLACADKPKGDAGDRMLAECEKQLNSLGIQEEQAIDEIMDAARTRILWTPMWESLSGDTPGGNV